MPLSWKEVVRPVEELPMTRPRVLQPGLAVHGVPPWPSAPAGFVKLSLAPVVDWDASQMRAVVGEWKETLTRSLPQVSSTPARRQRVRVSYRAGWDGGGGRGWAARMRR